MMPNWITAMMAATPALAWMFLGVGLPWALALLPRRDWRDIPLAACLTLAFGPALLTAWMFILGSFQTPLLKIEWILAGTATIAVIGWGMVWKKIKSPSHLGHQEKRKLSVDEKLLLALIAAALIVRWLATAYWPFTAYDALWVYGYEGRLYTLLGYIPTGIGYYPQFMPLQYTYLQLATGSVINDHAARAIIPWVHLGSIVATYALGSRLFSRRTGIYAAAIWALYPHVAQWARFGDLEIPVTFLFTAASAFFLMAWCTPFPVHKEGEKMQTRVDRQRYAIIAGLLLGIGMWTKPTMGAFIWGVALLVAVDWLQRLKLNRQSVQWSTPTKLLSWFWNPRLKVAIIVGLACLPLGAVWYLRNALLGHDMITLPTGFWLTLAARSGAEFGWPLLAIMMLAAWLGFQRITNKGRNPVLTLSMRALLIGLALVLAGVMPSILNTGRVGILENRMGLGEWLLLGAGTAILFVTLWRYWRSLMIESNPIPYANTNAQKTITTLGWILALALPYFVTWFYSYSYHYRLSFAMVPLLLMPTAVIAALWTGGLFVKETEAAPCPNQRLTGWRLAYLGLIAALALPGVILPLYDPNTGWDLLWTDKLPDDHAKYSSGNPALMSVVDGLQSYLDQPHDQPLVVVAPGMLRLPFFFPLEDIRVYDPARRGETQPDFLTWNRDMGRDRVPTRLDELESVTYFVYGTPETRGMYENVPRPENQVIAALALAPTNDATNSIMRRAWWQDDGTFNYTVYELHLENRFKRPAVNVPPPEGDVIFGGFARYLGHDIGGDYFWPGRSLILHLYWEVITPPPDDYMVYIHLRDQDGNVQEAWDGPVTRTTDGNYYSTLVWQPGEYIVDERRLQFDNLNAPVGDGYTIVIGMYPLPQTETRVPITIDGQPWDEGYTIPETIEIMAKQPGQ